MREVDPPDFLATIRVGLLVCDPDMDVEIACRLFGDTFEVTREGTPRDKEGRR